MKTVEIEREGHVATVMLNRPDVRNAFDETMIAEITQVFHSLGSDPGVRMIVLAANGTAFCAGADLNRMQKMAGYTYEENRADAMQLAEMLHTIYICPKPVVARIQGDCYGGGIGLVAACDIAVAAETTNFCLSETRIGLIPAAISPYVIGAMGRNAARRYFLTAERFSAGEAYRIGLVHAVVRMSELNMTVKDIVRAVVANSPHAVKEAKRLIRDVAEMPLTDALIADTAQRIADIRSSDEGREGLRAFLEKRKPGWAS